ncbi:MAG: hypothetical protein M1816_004963 [Peltula sp. TS41687]|nr:MAG: hypothetical protein M1816_004963 [Peltula sp. TS41687]
MTTSYLALAFLATIATAIPAAVPSSDSLSVAAPSMSNIDGTTVLMSDTHTYQFTHTDEPPPDFPGLKNQTITWFNATEKHSLSKRWKTCDKDPSYVAGATTWTFWSKNYCRFLFGEPYGASTSPLTVSGFSTLRVDLSDGEGRNNLAFVVVRPAQATAEVKMTQKECRKGFQDIIDYAISYPECQGYSGRRSGDGMGSFYGGGSGAAVDGNSPEFYMWIERPGYSVG